MNQDDKVLLGLMGAREAEALESRLAGQGLHIATIYNHSTCKSGCSPSKEIWARGEDVPLIQQLLHDDRLAMLKDLGVNPDQLNQVYDPDQEHAKCPACGFDFSTKHKECPECGLTFV